MSLTRRQKAIVISLTTLSTVALLGIAILRFQKVTISGSVGSGSVSLPFQKTFWGFPLKFMSKEEKWSDSELVYLKTRFAVSRLVYDIAFFTVVLCMTAVTAVELQLIALRMRFSLGELLVVITSLCLMFGVYHAAIFTADALPSLVDPSERYTPAKDSLADDLRYCFLCHAIVWMGSFATSFGAVALGRRIFLRRLRRSSKNEPAAQA